MDLPAFRWVILMRRAAWLLFAVAGCAAPTLRPVPDAPVARSAEPDEADHFALAAERLDKGDEAGALPHLAAHLKANPDAVAIRAHLAELHFNRGEPEPAKRHYERFARDAAGATGPLRERLAHAHARLMELAAAEDDAFGELLHRGIGLLLLVRQWDAESDADADADALTETTLVRAAATLKAAREVDRHDPRVHLYLAEAWGRLGQHTAARAALRTAKELLPDARLGDAERARIRSAE